MQNARRDMLGSGRASSIRLDNSALESAVYFRLSAASSKKTYLEMGNRTGRRFGRNPTLGTALDVATGESERD